MKNAFTIDTEDWFHANYEDNLFQNDGNIKSTVEENTDIYLNILDEYGARATFFILGFVAEEHPQLVKRIASMGHEIASHGYGHQLVYKQTPDEFREDVYRSKCMLEDLIGKHVLGYRAPSWSITEKSFWALGILNELGFKYDSSIFPFKNFLYGVDGAPRFAYKAKRYCENAGELLELPPSTVRIPGLNLPFSGGFYFRALPRFMISACCKKVNLEDKPVVFYLHPREIDPKQPRLKLSARDSLIHYYGIQGCEQKFRKIVQKFSCTSMQDAFNIATQ